MKKAIAVWMMIVCCCGIAAAQDYTPIDRSGMEAVASQTSYGSAADTIDDNTGTFWQYNADTAWLRIDMRGAYSIERFGYYPRSGGSELIHDFNFYVTNDPDDWSTPVSSGQFLATTGEQAVDLTTPASGRYVVLEAVTKYASSGTVGEVYLYGAALDPIVSSFTAADADTGSELLTNNSTVVVAITGVMTVDPIAGYIVTESAETPDPSDSGWSGATAPTSYTIQGAPGDVTLYAYAKDTSDIVSVGKSATIFYNPTAPTVSDVLALGSTETSAAVLWHTDTEAYGRLKYRALGEEDWIYTDWEANAGTTHARSMTDLVADTPYTYAVISNEVEEAPDTYLHSEWASEIPKSGITTFAVPDAAAGQWNWSGNLIDGLAGGNMWHTGSAPAWVRFDMGAAYRVQRLEHHPRDYYRDVNIYVTNSSSTDKAEWGDPVLTTQFPQLNERLGADFVGIGRYVIFDAMTSWTGYFSSFEFWLYGVRVDPTIDTFVVTDQSTGSELFTNSATVDVSLSATAPDGEIAGYMIREDDVQPAVDDVGWVAVAPGTYDITGPEGLVTLTGWAKGPSGAMISKSVQIAYSTAEPAISNVEIFGTTETDAIIVWDTDVVSVGRVRYRAVGDTEWMATPWETVGSASHTRLMTGLGLGTTYDYIVESNEAATPQGTYLHENVAPEIPKEEMTATSPNPGGYPPGNTIDGLTGNLWMEAVPTWLRLDFGSRYRVQRFSYLPRGDHYIKDYRIFVTDSDSTDPAEWGDPVLAGRAPNSGDLQVRDFIAYGRYLILAADTIWANAVTAHEVWAYGVNVDTQIEAFSVADTSTGSTVLTDTPLVNVNMTVAPSPGTTIAGYMITQTPDVPLPEDENWLDTQPAVYPIAGDPGQAMLYLWVKDSNDKIVGATATIFYMPGSPAVSNVAIYGNTDSNAWVTWTTDALSLGTARYREQGSTEWLDAAWEGQAGTSHAVLIDGLAWETSYEVMIVNNETEESPVVYLHDSLAPEIPKSVMAADGTAGAGPAEAAIDGSTASWPAWQAGVVPAYLRIDLGAPYRIARFGYLPRNSDHSMKDYEIYITDVDSLVPADWGEPAAAGVFDFVSTRSDVNVFGSGRYVILYGGRYLYGPSAAEIWLYGEQLGPSVESFSVADQSTGSTLFTDSTTVDVELTVSPAAGTTVAGYMINETADAPAAGDAGWNADPIATYTFMPFGDGEVSLYPWAKDSSDVVAGGITATIYYGATPALVSNVSIVPGLDGTATITWTTDIPTFGEVHYTPIDGGETLDVADTAAKTSHRLLMTMALATVYSVVIVNNEFEEPTIRYPEYWPIPGDVNFDCVVNILDLIGVRNHLNQDPDSPLENQAYNVNGDDAINILDMIFVRNRLNTSCPEE